MLILKLPSQNITLALNLAPIRNAYEFRKYICVNNENLQQKIVSRHQERICPNINNSKHTDTRKPE
jgi:hypothetical protein